MTSDILEKLMGVSPSKLRLFFIIFMVAGVFVILGGMYLIYETDLTGINYNDKEVGLGLAITFSAIHIVFTWLAYKLYKKMYHMKNKEREQRLEAQKIDRTKDEFIAMVTHELRTPLVPILSYTKMLLANSFGELNAKQKEKLQVILNGTESLNAIIEDLLDLHKAELGQMKMHFEPVDIRMVADQAFSIVQELAQKRHILLLNLVLNDIRLEIDPRRIVQVFTNLIKNAIDFVPEGGLIMLNAEPQNDNIVFSVADTGCGITKGELDSIFKKFYQVDTSTTRERGGTGLGLSICRVIVEQHGGKIWAESDVGIGTTMKFSLPTIARDIATKHPQSIPEACAIQKSRWDIGDDKYHE